MRKVPDEGSCRSTLTLMDALSARNYMRFVREYWGLGSTTAVDRPAAPACWASSLGEEPQHLDRSGRSTAVVLDPVSAGLFRWA